MMSETSRYRHLTTKYCQGCGVDVASQGDPVVPWAMSLDLPHDLFAVYCGGDKPKGPIQLRGHADGLPFDDESLDFLYSSHLLEDYEDWEPVLRHWVSKLKRGGNLIILIPDKERWAAAMDKGQLNNPWHKHEGRVGELSTYADKLGLDVLEDRLTDCFPGDYSILFAAQKK